MTAFTIVAALALVLTFAHAATPADAYDNMHMHN